MTDYYAKIDKATGEHEFVAVPKGRHPKQHGNSTETHRYVKLHREPSEHDKFDGKKLYECGETKAAALLLAKLNAMNRVEFLEYVLTTVDERAKAERP